ncbi:Cruciform DNA binding protein [Ascochyta rabiei]|uniref:Cruciform DNA binding protein n=1 Tax=Didymella rabiei TaxID=5454 RepID=UPI00220C490C|nr:Cruciform DNA binding protein [Ascochyta rabiei]UPX20145.1 Cruciform DNA binding protein [Ascochyta rabiei]
MGKYTFTWEHDANDVYVTGTFDDWKKTVELEQEDGIFKKTVELPKTKTQYKFVVNGNWCINESAPKEDDGHGIVNNILLPENIVDEPAHTLSSAAPTSSTAALAGAVPKVKDMDKARSNESIPVNLKEAPEQDDADAKVSVAPIPATAGAGNPIHLAPGDKVPHPSTLTSNTISSTARTDEDAYYKSGSQAPQLPPVDLTPQSERPANGGMFGLPSQLDHLVPESSLPMGVDAQVEKDTGVHIQSAAPTSSTAFLAGQVPKEPRGVPDVVTESQKEAGFAPEAAANSEAVLEKKEVEQELKEKVPEKTSAENDHAPALEADSSTSVGESIGAVAGGVAAAATVGAGLFAGAIYAAKEKTAEAVGLDKDATVGETASAVGGKAVDSVGLDSSKTAADNVYLAKDKTLDAAGLDKNATATENAYLAKDKTLDAAGLDKNATAADNAYLAKDKTAHATGLDKAADSAYAAKDKLVAAVGLDNSASATDNAYLAKDKAVGAAGFNGSAGTTAADDVPVVVAESQKEAHASPEAAANAEAVIEKSQFEQELLSQVPKSHEHGESAPSVAVPAVVSDSQREGHASPEAAANFGAVHEKQDLEDELLRSVPRTNASGESAPAIAVPAIVSESQQEAHSSPEAAANPIAVHDKKDLESELLKTVSRTDESGEHAPAIASAPSAATSASKTELPVRGVPDIVAESQKEAHVLPEASANTEAVAEKKELESELLSQVKKTNESGEPAPTLSAATATTAPGLSGTGSSAPALSDSSYPLSTNYQPASEVEIKRALSGASDEPSTSSTGGLNAPATAPAQTEATKAVAESAAPVAVSATKAVEPIASSSNADATSAPTTDGLNAPASSSAQTEATKAAAEPARPAKEELFKPTTLEQRQPTVTTGTETGTTDAKSEGLAAPETSPKDRKDSDVSPKGTPGSQSLASNSAATDKKNKRRSFFGKLKDKFSSKN